MIIIYCTNWRHIMYKCIYTFIDNSQKHVSHFTYDEMYNFCIKHHEEINWFDCYNNRGERMTLI